MTLIALGLNHQTAPLDIREQVALSKDQAPTALLALRDATAADEVAIVSTCNRTELYLVGDDSVQGNACNWLQSYHKLPAGHLESYLYCHRSADAVRHLLRVAIGLDSQILGEPQILGQMKQAWQMARANNTIGLHLDRLFQHTFATAKKVRTETDIGAGALSVAFAAVKLAEQIFGDFEHRTALLVGSGEMISLAARHFRQRGVSNLIFVNRTVERAQALATEHHGLAAALNDISQHLHQADIVISSTAADHAILSASQVEHAMRQRKREPMFLVDLAVPRDVEPSVADIDQAYLYTIDDLSQVIESGLIARRAAAEQAEQIVELRTRQHLEWIAAQRASDIVKRFRHNAQRESNRQLEAALKRIESGHDPEQVVKELSHKLSRALLHVPTQLLKSMAQHRSDALLQQADTLIKLDADSTMDKE